MKYLGINEFRLELSDLMRRLDCGECFVRMHWARVVLEQPWQQERSGRDALGDINATASSPEQQ